MSLLDDLCGPVATIECQRAIRPKWLRWLRMVAAIPAAGIAVVVVWIWMLWAGIEPNFRPGNLLGGGLFAVEITQTVLALLLSPAIIAGVIASEKDRGTLTLLLASRLSSRDIILGRLAGCFSQVFLIAAAALPMIVLLAAFRRVRLYELLLLIGLPAAVALGAGGMAVAASTLAKRGRDALLATYLIEVLLILASFFGMRRPEFAWLQFFNPFTAMYRLVFAGDVGSATFTTALWLLLAAAGTLLAILQLRPAYRRQTGGQTRKRLLGRRWAPAVSDRPMLWKELYIESKGSLGMMSRWLTRLFVTLLAAGGTVVLGFVAWNFFHGTGGLPPAVETIAMILAATATYVVWLIEWATGLRAAGVITGERQRSTWDAILTSPLEGREIITAKVCGSLYSLRYLALATCFAWSAAVLAGHMSISACATSLALLVAGSAFMAAIGVAVSMAGSSPNRGMAITIGMWMVGALGTSVIAGFLSGVAMLLVMFVAAPLAESANFRPSVAFDVAGLIWGVFYVLLRVGLYLGAALLAISWVLARFDALAGRMGTIPLGELAKRSFDSLTGIPIEDEPKPAAP